MGWGAIANAMGVKLGAVVSASKTNKPLNEFKAMNAQKSKSVAVNSTFDPTWKVCAIKRELQRQQR